MLDIEMVREPSRLQELIDNQQKRRKDVGIVNQVVEADQAWRNSRFALDELKKAKNKTSKEIGKKMKAKEPKDGASELPEDLDVKNLDADRLASLTIPQLKSVVEEVKRLEAQTDKEMNEFKDQRDNLWKQVGNLLHDTVALGDDEETANIIERTVGNTDVTHKYSHVDLVAMVDGVDMEAGSDVAGNREYYLEGPLLELENALKIFALQMLKKRGFKGSKTPFVMKKDVMQQVAQLSQFDEELYKVTGKSSERSEDKSTSEKYLIATSEQPLAAKHRNKWLSKDELPIKYAGVSTCFRQEVGSHGRDTRGIFRVHQFDKVEQFVYCSPHSSWDEFEKLINNAEDFCKALNIPYQIVNIAGCALNDAAAKKFDLEAWFPGSKAFRELVSCSNCTDYQARRLKVRFGMTKKMQEKVEFVHMLNATMCATTRVICAILENNQVNEPVDEHAKGGIRVPKVLSPYMSDDWKEFIPFVKEAPIDKEVASKKPKKDVSEGVKNLKLK